MGETNYQWDGLMVNFMGLYWVKNDGIPSGNDCYIAIGYLAIDFFEFSSKNSGSFHSYVKLPEGIGDSLELTLPRDLHYNGDFMGSYRNFCQGDQRSSK